MRNLRYALSPHFVDRLEQDGKMIFGEKVRIKDMMEDVNVIPKDRDMISAMKKDLRRLNEEKYILY